MKLRAATLALFTCIGFALSCESPNEPPVPDGRIVFRFDSNPAASMTANTGALQAAATFDSVVVRVFRPGPGVVQEAAKGVALDGAPTDVTISCIAENHKRVSVELFTGRAMTYHGANTNVNVVAGRQTPVPIDAYEFIVDTLDVSPQAVPEGSSFKLYWGRAAAASWYQVQSSVTPDFADVEWEQNVTDTLLDHEGKPGAHYFRVIPRTPFAFGHPEGPRFAYVTGGSQKVLITDFLPPRVIPGEQFTIIGENLDFPGTTARIGPDALPVVRASWDSLVVRLPRSGRTNLVTVTSGSPGLGSDTLGKPLVALRVAYVTVSGGYAGEYVTALEGHSDDFDDSGVAIIPISDLDTRDMNVFDIIVVAPDTGTLPVNWGGGEPARASAIASSGANVLAMGKGGAVFLSLVANGANVPTVTSVDSDRQYFEPDTGEAIFNTPHSVSGPDLTICTSPASSVALSIPSPYPASVNLYASTGKSCLITCSPNNLWALADFRVANTGGKPVVYFYWGFAGNPSTLTTDGGDCLGNIMYMLSREP